VEFFKKATNFPFMSTRKIWYALSIALMAISIGSFFVRGLNLAVDFTGGVQVQATFTNAVNLDAVRAGLTAAGFHEPQVQNLGSSREAAIRLPAEANQSGEVVRAKVSAVLHAIDAKAEITSLDVVGSQVGSELKSGALLALAATLALIFIYIAMRFHTWRLSVGAILAVLHDPILVLGAFSLWQTSFDLPVVSAMLAVIGYSLNDTVVVFDRIRERFDQSPAGAGGRSRSVNQPDPVANHHDQGGNPDRGSDPVPAWRRGAARLFRGAHHRHSGRHLFLDLHLERDCA
jgi:preprotein translocase subunit SecF